MPLTEQKKNQLRADVAALINFGEPEALLGMLRHLAQRQADDELTPPEEAQRWENLANALAQTELTIEHMNAPKTRQDKPWDQMTLAEKDAALSAKHATETAS